MGVTLIAQESGDVSSKVQQLEKEMHEAQMNNDASWYDQHLADGYVEGYSWGEWADRAGALKQMQDKSIKFKKGDVSDMKVATLDQNVAIAHYKFTYDATMNGTRASRAFGDLQRHLDQPVRRVEDRVEPLFPRGREIERRASVEVTVRAETDRDALITARRGQGLFKCR